MPIEPNEQPPSDWRGDFASMHELTLENWADATPSQRLRWLEEALAFAHRMGALPVPRDGQRSGR